MKTNSLRPPRKVRAPLCGPDLPQAKYIALYYSAGWCGPCHKFTPELVKFYNEKKSKYPGFEVVYVSQDESANAMDKCMGEMAMPWPAVR
jgi:thiol-disulfide isomerase/thioredoxin